MSERPDEFEPLPDDEVVPGDTPEEIPGGGDPLGDDEVADDDVIGDDDVVGDDDMVEDDYEDDEDEDDLTQSP
ncbi:hypothetical protein [Nissabacter sp. SGAir0207]|uniref:hypothetical protein n=1 Tax=Nissabacter sp. SGAir0207 TaxID=2126321 RepID=UPI0010CD2B8E|nr:hypothetical protein [Nissabacter sp. SGAir0207]QCR36397.1 hypothetical protein C1N62_09955 [Nissabacter sp. SGAir0207]